MGLFLPGWELPRRTGRMGAGRVAHAVTRGGRPAEPGGRAGQRADPDVAELSVGILAVQAEGPAQVRPLGVGEPGQQLAVTRHGDLVAGLDDADAVRGAHPEARGPARGEESLTA